ncbi:MAG: hypothetical protein LBN74_08245 [Prevotella sp.]|jgi:DNA repair photolyase|nr:hypothetical protein [Prevotella sp.]
MITKPFKGKAIYNPSGKAGEYSYWACNFYVGCSNNCTYCYLKKGVLSHVWSLKTNLKKCFRDEDHAIDVFEKELMQNLSELQECGLFFSFTTDPFLDLTMDLTLFAMKKCLDNGVKVKVLTKNAENPLFAFIGCSGLTTMGGVMQNYFSDHRNMIAIGFTLTGNDELEPNASPNSERIKAMQLLHEAGFKTWASIEPIIDIEDSKEMIRQTVGWCDLYKIGLESGKTYNKTKLIQFVEWCNQAYITKAQNGFYFQKNYFKDSLLKQAGINREELPNNCVGRDYNIFLSRLRKGEIISVRL